MASLWHHHLLHLAWLLHWQPQQFVSCNLHEEGVENPNLFGVDVPDEGRLFPEALSYLVGWGWKGEVGVGEDLFLKSSPVVLSRGWGPHDGRDPQGEREGRWRPAPETGGRPERGAGRGTGAGSPQGRPHDTVCRVQGPTTSTSKDLQTSGGASLGLCQHLVKMPD